ncbi:MULTISPECIES: sensor histidine kinase [unclassified Microbacterium]|uniref:sensor histidine kinase n=1 Tax=unclassified Microbacterium TaxID=2609290 RepID=UPI00300FFF54
MTDARPPEHGAAPHREAAAPRREGLSVRLKLTLSYALLVIGAGTVLLAVVALYVLRYIPEGNIYVQEDSGGLTWTAGRTDIIRAFVPRLTLAFVVLILIGLVGGWFLAGRMLRPLTRIGEAARLAAQGSLDHRIRMSGAGDEFRRLADVFDTMLDRIQSDVERERRFAANASHELRTPLSISRALIEVAEEDPDRDVPELLARLHAANERAIALTEALLLLARIEARPPAPTDVDLSLAAEEAVEILHPLADRRGVHLEISADPATVRGDAALLNQLALNLVQNAVVHNVPGGTAWVRTRVDGGFGALIVENTGALLDPAVVAVLAEPFQRGAQRTHGDDAGGASGAEAGESIATGSSGTGLGLAIASSIVDALGGSLHLRARPEGGLLVHAAFPLATPR